MVCLALALLGGSNMSDLITQEVLEKFYAEMVSIADSLKHIKDILEEVNEDV